MGMQDVLLWLRRKGYRVNLRGLAERQTLAWIGIVIMSVWGFCWLCSLISSMNSGNSGSHQIPLGRLETQRHYMSNHPSTYRFDAKHPSTFNPRHDGDAL